MNRIKKSQLNYLDKLEKLLSDPDKIVNNWRNYAEDKDGWGLGDNDHDAPRACRFCILSGLRHITNRNRKMYYSIINIMLPIVYDSSHSITERWSQEEIKDLLSKVREKINNS